MKFANIVFAGFAAVASAAPWAFGQKSKTPVDAATYAQLSKYPGYSTAIYLLPEVPNCIWPFGSTLVQLIDITFSDTQMGIFRNDADKEFIVGIPGANSTFDDFTAVNFGLIPYIASEVLCPFCHVHQGFLYAWNSISSSVINVLRSQLTKYPSYKIVIAGHSLGGALCSLAYPTLVNAKLPIRAAFCSGSPRVGDQFFANYIDKLSGASDTNPGNYYRITHYNDGVPQLPPLGTGFVHPRTEFFEAAYNSTLGQTYRCYGQEAADCNLSLGVGKTIDNAHATYAGVRYDCKGGYSPNACETCPYYTNG